MTNKRILTLLFISVLVVLATAGSARAATIQGKTWKGDTGLDLTNVSVQVLDGSGAKAATVCVGTDGTYFVFNLAAGAYTVAFVADGSCGPIDPYPTRYWPDSKTLAGATAITLGADEIKSGVDGHLRLRDVRTLTVNVDGPGKVVSTPAGISCPGTCSADFPENTKVMLSATANGSATFVGWTGDCNGTGVCEEPADADRTVSAQFSAVEGQTKPTCAIKPSAKVKQGKLKVAINCDQSAKRTLAGTVKYRIGKKTTTLRLKSVTVKGRTATLTLPAAARKALSKKAKVSASFKLSVGGKVQATATLKRLG